MTIQLICPSCRQPIFFSRVDENEQEPQERLCSGCRYKYVLASARVLSCASRVETLQSSKYHKQPSHHRIYELRLAATNNEIIALRLEIPGAEEQISALPEDELILLYTLRDKNQEDLVWIKNLTTGRSYLVHPPGVNARSTGLTAGFLVLFASGVLAIVMNFPIKFFLPVAVPVALGAGVTITRLNDSRLKDKQEIARLSSEQHLLGQMHQLEQRLEELKQELATNRKTLNRLKALREKMRNAADNLYLSKEETISKGIAVLEKQRRLTQSLIDGYTRVVSVLDIEYDTANLAEKLPDDISGQILERMEELKAIEAKREELALLVDPAKLLRES